MTNRRKATGRKARPSKRPGAVPGYCRHAALNKGFSTYRDQDGARRRRYHPGSFGSPESHAGYREFLAEWEAGTIAPRDKSAAARAGWRKANDSDEGLY